MSDNGLRATYALVSLAKTLSVCAAAVVVCWQICGAVREVGNEVKAAREEISAIKARLAKPLLGMGVDGT